MKAKLVRTEFVTGLVKVAPSSLRKRPLSEATTTTGVRPQRFLVTTLPLRPQKRAS